ncbi:MAG TPA: Stp1/IreP family PP2C-type Ser/Thr phosphatase [Bacillota bacterium]|nr:Stp1/IreP family PP2C-type Ser/Thr phosphatase [Bacillota bacterium]
MVNLEAKFLTDRGLIRTHNEDAGGIFYNKSGQLLAVIADGMGGHKAGDIASQLAVSLMQEKWLKEKETTSPEQTEKWLTDTIAALNVTIYERSLEHENFNSMGTTIVSAIVTDDYVTVAHIGDSRCYIYNENGFTQVTEDHSLVNELMRSGQISKADAKNHPRKNIVLKALGTEKEELADVQTMSWEKNNKLLLCSDGLTDKVMDDELAKLIAQDEQVDTIGQQMIDLANDRGGEDNISLVIVNYPFSDEGGDHAC